MSIKQIKALQTASDKVPKLDPDGIYIVSHGGEVYGPFNSRSEAKDISVDKQVPLDYIIEGADLLGAQYRSKWTSGYLKFNG